MKKLLEKLFTEIPKILCAIIISFMVIDLLYFIVPKASMLLSAIISAYIGVSISESVYNK